MNFESGAFGNPQALETLILFWSKMELLHYPGAGETKQYLIEQKRAQDEAVLRQQNAMHAQMQNVMSEIDAQAKADAEAKVFGGADGGAKIQSNVNPRHAVREKGGERHGQEELSGRQDPQLRREEHQGSGFSEQENRQVECRARK